MAALLGFGLLWAGVERVEGGESSRRGDGRPAVATFAFASIPSRPAESRQPASWSNPAAALSWVDDARARSDILALPRRAGPCVYSVAAVTPPSSNRRSPSSTFFLASFTAWMTCFCKLACVWAAVCR